MLEYKTEWVSDLGMKNVEKEIFIWQDKVNFCYAFWKAEIVKKIFEMQDGFEFLFCSFSWKLKFVNSSIESSSKYFT